MITLKEKIDVAVIKHRARSRKTKLAAKVASGTNITTSTKLHHMRRRVLTQRRHRPLLVPLAKEGPEGTRGSRVHVALLAPDYLEKHPNENGPHLVYDPNANESDLFDPGLISEHDSVASELEKQEVKGTSTRRGRRIKRAAPEVPAAPEAEPQSESEGGGKRRIDHLSAEEDNDTDGEDPGTLQKWSHNALVLTTLNDHDPDRNDL